MPDGIISSPTESQQAAHERRSAKRDRIRTVSVVALAVALSLLLIVAIVVLQQSAADDRSSQLKLRNVRIELQQLQTAPFKAISATGGSPEIARQALDDGTANVKEDLAGLMAGSPPSALLGIDAALKQNLSKLEQIYRIGVSTGDYGARADAIGGEAAAALGDVDRILDSASRDYDARATDADLEATLGAGIGILILLGSFGFFYMRSSRIGSENRRLAAQHLEDSLDDVLTGLRNRRALVADLGSAIDAKREFAVAIFDLDGFKIYNDTFGHPAGDSLLIRLARNAEAAVAGQGTVYRMGGDEFCVLAELGGESVDELMNRVELALTSRGDSFTVGCSYGAALIPREASNPSEALNLADQRMYELKAARSTAQRQSADVLLQVLTERDVMLSDHGTRVLDLAEAVARDLELPDFEVGRIRAAAELHDIGKCGIPDAILNKPGPLDDEEWEFMKRHAAIGERIVLAAPSLAYIAPLISATHERVDGTGYPNGLSGDSIPIGAKVVAVCDAFDAMVSERPYRAVLSYEEAIAELQRCSGTAFDQRVVDSFVRVSELLRAKQSDATDSGPGPGSATALAAV